MSRSSGSQTQQNIHPFPNAKAGEQDPREWTTGGGAPRQGGHPQGAQQGYPQPSYPAPGEGPAGDPFAGGQNSSFTPAQQAPSNAPGAHQVHQNPAYGQAPQQGVAQQQQGQYPSHYDPYAQAQLGQYFAQAGQGQSGHGHRGQGGYQLPAGQSSQALPGQGLRGGSYDQWQNPGQSPDPRSYDLSSYQHPTGAPAQQAGLTPADYQQQTAHGGAWGAHDPYGQQPVDPALDPHGYGPQDAGDYEQGYDEDDYEDDDAPSGRRWIKIGAVLGMAIAVGGFGMYASEVIFGPGSDGATPVVKNSAGPSKVKPEDPGGRKFDHADSKIMGRLGDAGKSTGGSSVTGGSKKVSTLVVNPDGSIQAPTAAPEASAGPAPTGVPGLSIVDISAPPQPAADAAPAKPAPTTTAATPEKTPAPAPTKPVIISKAQTTPAKPAPKPAPKKPAPKATAATTPAPAAPRPTGAGYVAVLASVPATGSSQLDALKQFANLQSKYANLLGNKTPEVQLANLGEKGTYHRLLAGPPGSRESVSELCRNLKAAGHSGCWPLAY